MMKNGDRVDRIAAFVAEHYREVVEPLGYKAFLVAVDREACALYKKALDKILPPEYSEVVYSPGGKNDSETLTEWYITGEEEKRIRKAFRDSASLPKILIVTEKLLTGYDAPILYCMYLDKPMRNHTLMQTIARANRVFPGKHSGVIVDYANVFASLEKALAIYGAGKSGKSPVQDKQKLVAELRKAQKTLDATESQRIIRRVMLQG